MSLVLPIDEIVGYMAEIRNSCRKINNTKRMFLSADHRKDINFRTTNIIEQCQLLCTDLDIDVEFCEGCGSVAKNKDNEGIPLCNKCIQSLIKNEEQE